MTCRSASPISFMICAICSATRPLTPVSISSKMMVGSFTEPLIMAFSESMTRAISPPDATSLTGSRGVLLLALKRNATRSAPSAERGLLLSDTSNLTFGMPRGTRRLFISCSTLRAAFWRVSESFFAFSWHSCSSFASCSSISLSCSSLLSICESCSSSFSLMSMSSSTDDT